MRHINRGGVCDWQSLGDSYQIVLCVSCIKRGGEGGYWTLRRGMRHINKGGVSVRSTFRISTHYKGVLVHKNEGVKVIGQVGVT